MLWVWIGIGFGFRQLPCVVLLICLQLQQQQKISFLSSKADRVSQAAKKPHLTRVEPRNLNPNSRCDLVELYWFVYQVDSTCLVVYLLSFQQLVNGLQPF
jgi:hypothetical protein